MQKRPSISAISSGHADGVVVVLAGATATSVAAGKLLAAITTADCCDALADGAPLSPPLGPFAHEAMAKTPSASVTKRRLMGIAAPSVHALLVRVPRGEQFVGQRRCKEFSPTTRH